MQPRRWIAGAAQRWFVLAGGLPARWGRRRVDLALINVRDQIRSVLLDANGIEGAIEAQSRLAGEIAQCTDDTSRHFHGQLSQHATLLAVAIGDAMTALSRLDEGLPFSGIVLTRGLLECAADLYWLSDPKIDGTERTRRAFLIFLRQHETQVRQIEQYAKRAPPHGADHAKLAEAIAQGWESLQRHAQDMASAGFDLRTARKPGAKYVIGDEKPAIGALVDKLIADHIGTTGLSLYSMYSSVAHGEGEGLGTLLMRDDTP